MAKFSHPKPPDGDWGKNLITPNFVNTLNGHIGDNLMEDPELSVDMIRRRNERDFDEAWPSNIDGYCSKKEGYED